MGRQAECFGGVGTGIAVWPAGGGEADTVQAAQ